MFELSEKNKIIKNLLAVDISFLLILAAINCVSVIQPVLNQDGGLGLVSQSVNFGSAIIGSIVIPSIICKIFGFKWAMFIGECLIFTYVSFQAFPKWETLIPTSIFSGFGNAITGYIYGVYVTLLSKQYAKLKSVPIVEILPLFFGISGSILVLCNAVGSAQISLILRAKEPNFSLNVTNQNFTSYDYAASCGFNNCPDTPFATKAASYTKESIYGLCGALDALMLLAMITTILFMDNFKNDDVENEKNDFKGLAVLTNIFMKIDIWLLFPITVYSGFELTFIWFEFNRAFVSCLKGLTFVGWTNIFFGLLTSVTSLLMGILLKYIGTPAGIFLMLGTSFTQCTFVLSWTASLDSYFVIFVMVIGFSISLSCLSQITGLYGLFFPNRPEAFSAAAISQTFGFFIGSIISTFFCTSVKAYVYAGLVITSLICFVTILVKNTNKKSLKNSENK